MPEGLDNPTRTHVKLQIERAIKAAISAVLAPMHDPKIPGRVSAVLDALPNDGRALYERLHVTCAIEW